MDNNEKYDVIVIGGGAAGLMAAGVAAARGKSVLLLEKNRKFGEKLMMTGGGRCNITNADSDVRSFLSNYGKAADFLYSPFSKFGVPETFSFFESIGLPLVVQARNRVFPKTEKAFDVLSALQQNNAKLGVKVRTGCTVRNLLSEGTKIAGVKTNIGEFQAKSYILATGGVSHPETGSTGDGFRWLKDLGHTIHDPKLTIVPLAVKEDWVKSLSGVSLSFMKIAFYLDGKKQFSKTGKVLFTHFGLSGPLILNSASLVGDLLEKGDVTAKIDAFPDTDLGALDTNILHVLNENKNKQLKTIFKEIVPSKTQEAVALLLPDINFETPVHSLSKEKRKKIVDLLKALPVTITGLMGKDRAVAADGGVTLSEIDTRTMKSTVYSNLYIVGDMLHINRPSGGFSLQLCWTTGFVAGNSV